MAIAGTAGLLVLTAVLSARDGLRRMNEVETWRGSEAAQRFQSPGPESLPEEIFTTQRPSPPVVDLNAPGDAANGERIFFERASVMCSKCHVVHGRGGQVGPDLSRIGAEKSRAYLLESLLEPNRVIAEGYASLLVQTWDGALIFGVVREDGPQQIRLIDAEGVEHVIPVDDIEARRPGLSAMPADLTQNLTADEIRDLIEYLTTLR